MNANAELIKRAIHARTYSYSPYSHFAVGAALLCSDGSIFEGCNIESASFSPTNCAERTAIFNAVSKGIRSFCKIAIVGGPSGGAIDSYCAPCGVCRQVMEEFCIPDRFVILLAKSEDDYREYTLAQLLPEGFGPDNLK